MAVILLALALLLAAPQMSDPPQQPDPKSGSTMEHANERYELARQAAIHLNELAGNIHSESDAREFVDAVAGRFLEHEYPYWAPQGVRYQVAHAEYEAVAHSRLIPEQRIVNIWNEYVREIDAPAETLITAAELHNLRDATSTSSRLMWKREGFGQMVWTVPNIYAVDANGKVADGCRAIESLKIFHDMFYLFETVSRARERVQKGVLVSDLVQSSKQNPAPRPKAASIGLKATADPKPVILAASRYLQSHSERDYRQLLERLFSELFPSE